MGVTAGIFFNFTKRDALSSVYKISMDMTQLNLPMYIIDDELERCGVTIFVDGSLKKTLFYY
jgi:hypothetical protein